MSISGELDYHTASRLRADLENVPLEKGVDLGASIAPAADPPIGGPADQATQ